MSVIVQQSSAHCPCGSGLAYASCCEPLHQGQQATSALALMRSRYCAFVRQDTAYLLRSWHSSTRPAELELDTEEQWLGLTIVASGHDWVHFNARFREHPASQRILQLEEKSQFLQEQGHWFYLQGHPQIVPIKIQRNDPCPCRSGKKYKQCCGR